MLGGSRDSGANSLCAPRPRPKPPRPPPMSDAPQDHETLRPATLAAGDARVQRTSTWRRPAADAPSCSTRGRTPDRRGRLVEPLVYSRHKNPGVEDCEVRLARLEGGARGALRQRDGGHPRGRPRRHPGRAAGRMARQIYGGSVALFEDVACRAGAHARSLRRRLQGRTRGVPRPGRRCARRVSPTRSRAWRTCGASRARRTRPAPPSRWTRPRVADVQRPSSERSAARPFRRPRSATTWCTLPRRPSAVTRISPRASCSGAPTSWALCSPARSRARSWTPRPPAPDAQPRDGRPAGPRPVPLGDGHRRGAPRGRRRGARPLSRTRLDPSHARALELLERGLFGSVLAFELEGGDAVTRDLVSHLRLALTRRASEASRRWSASPRSCHTSG